MNNQIVSYLTFHTGPLGIRNSLGRVALTYSLPELLDYLLYSHTTRVANCLKVAWDLGRFVGDVLLPLPEDLRKTLSKSPHRVRYGHYKLFYIPGKMFSVSKQGDEATFYDLSQYFPDDPEPEDVEKVQEKAETLLETLGQLGIPTPATLASPVAVARASKIVNEYKDTIPTIFDAPEPLWPAYGHALMCTPREWVSNYQVGHWDTCYSYDISSAYPWHASRLLDLRDCCFSHSDKLVESAYYGFVRGRITIYPDSPLAFCSSFLVDRGDGLLVNFTGTIEDYDCLLSEVRALHHYGLGEFQVKEGWYISPLNGVRPRMPFTEMMTRFYRGREASPVASFFLKRVMAGMVGKLLETREKPGGLIEYGDMYNPIYHAIVTTATRLQVLDFLAENGVQPEELLHVGVDGVRLSRYIPLPTRAGMGKWRMAEDPQPTIILSPGAILAGERHYKGMKYEELVNLIGGKPGAQRYRGRNEQGKNGKGDNVIDLTDLFLRQDRHYPKLPRTGGALLAEKYMSESVAL